MRSSDPDFAAWVEDARRVPILDAAREHGAHLKRSGQEHAGPCPICGGRRDKLAVHPIKGVFTCDHGSGPGGDVIALVQHLAGCTFTKACELLTGRPPPGRREAETAAEREERRVRMDQARQRRDAEAIEREKVEQDYRERERQRCRRFWEHSSPLSGTPAEAYLAKRNLICPPGARLRCARSHRLYASRRGQAPLLVHEGPAMFAAIVGPDGVFAGLHATWIDLDQDDGKARYADPETGEILPAKKVRGSKKGGRIELVRQASPTRLFVGEGIETVLSVWRALSTRRPEFTLGAAFWSSVDLGNLTGPAAGQVQHPTLRIIDRRGSDRVKRVSGPEPAPDGIAIAIPESVTELYLLGDGDSDRFTTETALERAARKHARPGRQIFAAFAPDGLDFNDVLRGKLAA